MKAVSTKQDMSATEQIATGHKTKVLIFPDGSCWPNPGPGSWAFVLIVPDTGYRVEQSGKGPEHTTNNRMELQAAIEALRYLDEPCSVEVFTDSQYLRTGAAEWRHAWARRGWQRKVKNPITRQKSLAPVLNADLWQEIAKLCDYHNIKWHWVRGHAGHEDNNRADYLAERARATPTSLEPVK